MLTLLTTIPLLFATIHALSPESGEDELMQAPAPEVEQPEYGAAVDRLREADSDPHATAQALSEAILALEEFGPQLAADSEARDLRQYARLNLARVYLLAKNDEFAQLVMDEVVREAMGDVVPAADFGPSLEEFYTERLKALEQEGVASLVVKCGMPCTVHVDERDVGPEPPPLLLGTYRVWIEDTTGERPTIREQVELNEVGQVHEIEFAPIPVPVKAPPPPPPPERILPRWAEITLTAVGVGLTTTGAVLVGLDGSETGSSGKPLNTVNGGAICLAFGVAALLPGVITLSVDERRLAGKAGRQAMVNWTMQF